MSLISYIEKLKSLLRKLKVSFARKRRQEKAKVLNHQVKRDPGQMYATIMMWGRMIQIMPGKSTK